MQVEAAYDVLFMASMKKRITGELQVGLAGGCLDMISCKTRRLTQTAQPLPAAAALTPFRIVLCCAPDQPRGSCLLLPASQVPTGVRYADVPQTKKRGSGGGGGAQRGGSPAPTLLQKLPGGVGLAPPKPGAAAGQAAVFAGLMGWALATALLEPPEAQAAETGGLQLALAGAWAIYQLRESKRLTFGEGRR